MRQNKTIQVLFSGFLLTLLLFSIAPTHWWHQCVSGHEHTYSAASRDQVQVETATAHCGCVHMVHHNSFYVTVSALELDFNDLEHSTSYVLFDNWYTPVSPRYLFSTKAPPAIV